MATSVLSGRRIITSNLTWNKQAESDRKRDTFPDAVNFLQESGMTIRVSTAANNSARFPVIGPAGTFKMETTNSRNNCGREVISKTSARQQPSI